MWFPVSSRNVELFYKLYINTEISQAFILGLVVCELFDILVICFLKVSAGLAQISETSRFRDRDKTETLAIRDQDHGSETRDLQKIGLKIETETET